MQDFFILLLGFALSNGSFRRDPDAVRFVIDIVFICVTRHQVFTRSVAKFFSFFFSDHTALCTVGTITLISFWGHGCVIRLHPSTPLAAHPTLDILGFVTTKGRFRSRNLETECGGHVWVAEE